MHYDEILKVARLEERRLATAVAALADHWEPFAGGVLACGVPGTWVNACVGAGMDGDGAPDGSMLDHLREFHRHHGVEPRIELASLVDAGVVNLLAQRGFVVRGFDHVLVRSLERIAPSNPSHAPAGTTIAPVDAGDAEQVAEFVCVALSGFPAADSAVAEPSRETLRRALLLPSTTAVVARIDGRVVGAGALEIVGEVACIFGASVLPEQRGRGIHRALLEARLSAAAARGARYATIGSRPGGATERNVRRMGFDLLYVRTAFVLPGEGLVRIVE